MASNYLIDIRQENENPLEQLYSGIPHDHLFNIELEFLHVSSLNPETTLETFNQSIICSRAMFLSEEYGPNIVLFMFADTGAPSEFLETFIVPDILSLAWAINGEPDNLGRKVIKLIVEVIFEVSTDDEFDRLIYESLSTINFKPASKSSIRALKRVKWVDEDHIPLKKRKKLVEGFSSKKECNICLDEFLDGDEVASMPCGHVYHDGCIVKWLETSHLCPLCRYQMPR